MTPTLLTDDAVPAWVALGHVLAALERPTPCQVDPGPFGSDSAAERREAAYACGACPALKACGRYADAARETWLVWAGEDRTPSTTRKTAKTEAAA